MTWLIRMTRVRGVIAAANRFTTSSSSSAGTGTWIMLSLIPSRCSRCLKVLSMRG